MSLLDKLTGVEQPDLAVHRFWGALVALADGKLTRAQVETMFSIATSGSDAAEFDALIAHYQNAVTNGVATAFLVRVHAIFLFTDHQLFRTLFTKAELNDWLTEASGETP